MSIGYYKSRLIARTYLPVATKASFIEEEPLAWRPAKASSVFSIFFPGSFLFLRVFRFDLRSLQNSAKLPPFMAHI